MGWADTATIHKSSTPKEVQLREERLRFFWHSHDARANSVSWLWELWDKIQAEHPGPNYPQHPFSSPAHPCLHFLGLEFSAQPGPVPLLLILNPSYSSFPDRSTLPSDNRNVLLALSRLSTSCSYQHIDYVSCHSFGCFWSIPCHVPSSLSHSDLFANPTVLSSVHNSPILYSM